MKKTTLLAIQLDDQGHLILPDKLLKQYGLQAGSVARLEQSANGFNISRSSASLAKVYVEPTNTCNLGCRTCMRNVWNEPPGVMDEETFARILQGIQAFSPSPAVFFGGFGEPLAHPRMIDMVRATSQAGFEVELISNGTMLDEAMALALIHSGLSRLWVSLDGASPESYSDVRLGASLPLVIENLSRLYRLRYVNAASRLKLGIAFVAMRRNIAELPDLIRLGQRLGADLFSISNVLPHTAHLQSEVLYRHSLYNYRTAPFTSSPEVDLPRMDLSQDLVQALQEPLDRTIQLVYRGRSPGPDKSSCPFMEKGSLSIRWDGMVSPCLPLLHTHEAYLDDRLRRSQEYFVGDIRTTGLGEIWESRPYQDLRTRLLDFDFSPCSVCNSCEFADANLEDCFGNVHPACGGCLWAQGFIQCP